MPRALTQMESVHKGETLNLRVQDQTGFELTFKMLDNSPVDIMMDAYAQRTIRERGVLRFFFDGEKLVDHETPKEVSQLTLIMPLVGYLAHTVIAGSRERRRDQCLH